MSSEPPGPFIPANYPPPSYPPAYVPPAAYRPDYGPPTWPAELGLVLPEAAVAVGDLPRICVVSGRPTEHMVRMGWAWAPPSTYLPGMLSRYQLAERTSGYLPIHPDLRNNRAGWVISGFLGFFLGLFVLVAGAVAGSILLCVLAVALMIAGVVAMAIHARPLPKVVRPAPGFLAIPTASPEFIAAFRAGRPAGQLPYAPGAKPSRRWLLLLLAPVLIPVIIVAIAVAEGLLHSAQCSSERKHENAGTVETLLAHRALGMQSGPSTDPQARELLVADGQLVASLNAVRLTVDDGAARDNYVGALTRYDESLRADLVRRSAHPSTQQLEAAQALRAADARLGAQMVFIPGGC